MIDSIYVLEDTPSAFARFATGEVRGRVVITHGVGDDRVVAA